MYSEYIEVDQFEMKKANYPDTLRSGGLGPCIAIGVYDPTTRSGYMMHEPHFQCVDLDGKIDEIREDYGDLTLTGYNSQLSNMSFERKRDRTDKKDKNVGYKNGLFLNNDLANAQRWDSNSIEERSKKLINQAIEIFGFDGE